MVQTGQVRCARGADCLWAELVDGVPAGGLIAPGADWHLDHEDDGPGWLGPSHAACNARAGQQKMIRNAIENAGNGNGAAVAVEKPLKWSRRWFDDPPLGTTALLEGGGVEVHVGRGVWVEAP